VSPQAPALSYVASQWLDLQSGVLLYLPRVTMAIGEVKGGRHWAQQKQKLMKAVVKMQTKIIKNLKYVWNFFFIFLMI